MAALLKNPDAQWPHMARTSFGPGNYSIRSERYRYIHYNDGSEEFYDHAGDPHEWNNLIENPELASLIEEAQGYYSLRSSSDPRHGLHRTQGIQGQRGG